MSQKLEKNQEVTDINKITETKVKAVKESNGPSTNTLRVLASFRAVIISLLIGLLLIVATGQSSSIGSFFEGFWKFNFSDMHLFTEWLATVVYLVPLGLALAVSFRMGLFNIGAAGQAMAGGTIAFLVASQTSYGSLGFLVTIAVGVSVGMMVALTIAFLKNKYNINEVISSIMINWMVFYLVKYIVTADSPIPDPIYINMDNDLRLDFIYGLFGEETSKKLNVGLFISIPLVFILWWAYSKTSWGYKQEVIGNNKNVGSYLGIDYKKEIYKTMAISGALAGLAGVIYYCGYNITLMDDGVTDIPAWSFNGITIALLGFNSPIGVLFASGLFAMFNPTIDSTIGGIGILDVVVASMITLIAISTYRINYGKRSIFKRGGGK